MHKILLRVFLIVSLIGVWASTQPSVSATLCGCLPPYERENWVEHVDWSRYEQIFRGVVVDEYFVEYDGEDQEHALTEFDVSVVWKNVFEYMLHDRIWVHHQGFRLCDYRFDAGEEYIVAVDFDDWTVYACDVTMWIQRGHPPTDELVEMLRFLGEGTVVPDGSFKPDGLVVTPLAHLEAKPPEPTVHEPTPLWQWMAVALGISASFGAFILWARRE